MTQTATKPQTETEKLFALDKPSLENLSYALRHPETWPKGFSWYFGHCNQCAMGLAHRLWSGPIHSFVSGREAVSVMAREFAMPYEAAESIFMKQTGKRRFFGFVPRTYNGITPEMVADQIDAYIAKAR